MSILNSSKLKKIIFVLIFGILQFQNLVSQDTLPSKKTYGLRVKFDIVLPYIAYIGTKYSLFQPTIAVEKSINYRHSAQFRIGTIRQEFTTSYLLYLDYRYYISKKRENNGCYLTPSLISLIERGTKSTEINIGSGGGLGYEYVFKNNIVFDIIVGIGVTKFIKRFNPIGVDYNDDLLGTLIIPRVELNIGYKF